MCSVQAFTSCAIDTTFHLSALGLVQRVHANEQHCHPSQRTAFAQGNRGHTNAGHRLGTTPFLGSEAHQVTCLRPDGGESGCLRPPMNTISSLHAPHLHVSTQPLIGKCAALVLKAGNFTFGPGNQLPPDFAILMAPEPKDVN